MVAAALCALAGTAHAQQTAYAPGQGSVNSASVNIEVRASVRSRCGFAAGGAPTGAIDQADFDRTGFSRDIPIVLNCSGASRVAVSSSSGGLSGGGASAPYEVALRLVADDGTVAAASCGSERLVAGASGCAFAGTASESQGLRLPGASTRANGSYLRVSAPARSDAAELTAGRYADTLTVTVSIAP